MGPFDTTNEEPGNRHETHSGSNADILAAMQEENRPLEGMFDPDRHEPLTARPWNEDEVRREISFIAQEAQAAFEGNDLWPTHPLDEPPDPQTRYSMLYMGAGGVIWGLRRLADRGFTGHDARLEAIVPTLVSRNREVGETQFGAASFLMGDSGLLLLDWQTSRSRATEQALFDAVRSNLRHPTREMLWGSPGTLVVALHMAAATQDARWKSVIREGAEILLDEMEYDEALGAWIWRQDMYGKVRCFIGAGHGFAGNVYPILRASHYLQASLVQEFVDRSWATLNALAIRAEGCANWHAFHDPVLMQGRPPLVQDCHGAPGIVVRLASVPRTEQWDRLLDEAGMLTWRAGPMRKGASLCHGTAGNGYAFLKLWERTGDERWLARARAFAMHSIEQVHAQRRQQGRGRFSLWTGDIGTALYLADCLTGRSDFPTLDYF